MHPQEGQEEAGDRDPEPDEHDGSDKASKPCQIIDEAGNAFFSGVVALDFIVEISGMLGFVFCGDIEEPSGDWYCSKLYSLRYAALRRIVKQSMTDKA